jgi:SPP1 family predicted phage head-tail adaptor
VRFERATRTDDGFSSDVPAVWTPIATVWASVLAVSDGEKWRAGALGATISHRIRVRFSSVLADLKPSDRAIFEGRTLQIGSVKEVGRREFLEINATEKV